MRDICVMETSLVCCIISIVDFEKIFCLVPIFSCFLSVLLWLLLRLPNGVLCWVIVLDFYVSWCGCKDCIFNLFWLRVFIFEMRQRVWKNLNFQKKNVSTMVWNSATMITINNLTNWFVLQHQHSYTFLSSFVPHLKNPRYRGLFTQNSVDSYYFSPSSEIQVSKFLVASPFRNLSWKHFCSKRNILFQRQNGGKLRACLIFSSTEAHRRNQFVNFQVRNSSAQDKSRTSKNDDVTEMK